MAVVYIDFGQLLPSARVAMFGASFVDSQEREEVLSGKLIPSLL